MNHTVNHTMSHSVNYSVNHPMNYSNELLCTLEFTTTCFTHTGYSHAQTNGFEVFERTHSAKARFLTTTQSGTPLVHQTATGIKTSELAYSIGEPTSLVASIGMPVTGIYCDSGAFDLRRYCKGIRKAQCTMLVAG